MARKNLLLVGNISLQHRHLLKFIIMQRNEKNQENENLDLRFENLKLVLQSYDLMKELYQEQKNDLEKAHKEIAHLKHQLQQTPVTNFQFNVN